MKSVGWRLKRSDELSRPEFFEMTLKFHEIRIFYITTDVSNFARVNEGGGGEGGERIRVS